MSIDETIDFDNPAGCPVTHFHEVNTESAAAGWHFDNFDAKREEGAVHTGIAGPAQYFLVTRMADGHVESMSGTLGGYKGVGEGGAIASPPAVANAINDALARIGVPALTRFPFGPSQIIDAINRATGGPA